MTSDGQCMYSWDAENRLVLDGFVDRLFVP